MERMGVSCYFYFLGPDREESPVETSDTTEVVFRRNPFIVSRCMEVSHTHHSNQNCRSGLNHNPK